MKFMAINCTIDSMVNADEIYVVKVDDNETIESLNDVAEEIAIEHAASYGGLEEDDGGNVSGYSYTIDELHGYTEDMVMEEYTNIEDLTSKEE